MFHIDQCPRHWHLWFWADGITSDLRMRPEISLTNQTGCNIHGHDLIQSQLSFFYSTANQISDFSDTWTILSWTIIQPIKNKLTSNVVSWKRLDVLIGLSSRDGVFLFSHLWKKIKFNDYITFNRITQ